MPKNRQRRSTPEQIVARKAEDRRLNEKASENLADPFGDVFQSWFFAAASGQLSPRILRYSLKNQLMLWIQAQEKNIALSDVDTFHGWRGRGRIPLPGGLRIIAPKGTDTKPEQDTNGVKQLTTGHAGTTNEQKQEERPRFRMMPVWDISQTTEIEEQEQSAEAPTPDGEASTATPGACPVCRAATAMPCLVSCRCTACAPSETASASENTAPPVEGNEANKTPARALWSAITQQIERTGYAIRAHNARGFTGACAVHPRRTVFVSPDFDPENSEMLRSYAYALSAILTDKHTATSPVAELTA